MLIRVLGPVAVYANGEDLNVGPRQQRHVLAVLAGQAGRPVTTETLIDRVWDEPPSSARRTVHVHVTRIRRLLEQCGRADSAPVRIRRGGGGYILDISPDRVDVHQLRCLVEQANAARCRDAHRAALLREAVALWSGDPLTDLTGGWASRTREAWRRQYLDAVIAWVHAELHIGNSGAVIGVLSDLTTDYPLVEGLAGAMMRALYAAGRPAQALEHYQAVRQHLADQLGADPGAELRALHQAILRGEPDPYGNPAAPPTVVAADRRGTDLGGRPGAGRQTATMGSVETRAPTGPIREPPASQPTLAARRHTDPTPAVPPIHIARLPPDVEHLVGRDSHLATLDAIADAPDVAPRVVVASGVAGCGKSALAVRWAHRSAYRFPDARLYLDLRGFAERSPMSTDAALDLLLWGLGVDPQKAPGDYDRKLAVYRGVLAARRVLVILDNARDAAQVRPLLPPASRSVVVVTSRDRLHGLVVYDGARCVDVGLLDPGSSTDLLSKVSGVVIAPDTIDPLTRLGELCAHLPLALRIVACRLTTEPSAGLLRLVTELADEEHRLESLRIDRVDHGILAVFRLSYRMLSVTQARAFHLIGLSPGESFSPAGLAALAGCADEEAHALIAGLVQANLLARSTGDRYEMHDLLRLYARDRGTAGHTQTELDQAERRMVDWLLDTSYEAYPLLSPRRTSQAPELSDPPGEPVRFRTRAEALAWFDAELVNLRAVIRDCAQRAWHRASWQLALNLFAYFHHRRLWSEWIEVYSDAILSARADGDRPAMHRLLNGLGVAYKNRGDLELALRSYLDSLRIAEELDEPFMRAALHINLGGLYTRLNQTDLAEHHLRSALAIPGYGENPAKGSLLWLNLGHLYFNRHRYDDANGCLRRGLDLATQTGDHHTQAYLHHGMGEVALQLRDHDAAIEHARRALELAHTARDPLRRAYALDLLGSALVPAAVDQARACWREAVEICRSLDHPLAVEASHWLDREVPTDPDEWFAVDGPRRFRINQLP